jgi:hypothetical protein
MAMDITDCHHCEGIDQPAAGPKNVKRVSQSGGPEFHIGI